MIYRGQVCGDVIVLSAGVRLPDGIEVLIEPVGLKAPAATASEMQMRNGVPVFPRNGQGAAPSLDLVNNLRDDAP